MSELDISALKASTVGYLYAQRSAVDMDPPYQRQGAVWSVDKQQLLIDSLLNKFDIPKIYFHQFPTPRVIEGRKVRWALVDGKQRMQAIWGFLENEFPLSDDFELIEDPSINARGLTYAELSESHPDLVGLLNATPLDVIAIKTDDVELIEEMFSRLNEAVPLNAAEKRNAIGGPARDAVKELIQHRFFSDKLPFGNTRYRHLDLGAKFLYWADADLHKVEVRKKDEAGHFPVRDVKKYRLDGFFKELKTADDGKARAKADLRASSAILDRMSDAFVPQDRQLLSSIGMVSVYYLLFDRRMRDGRKLPQRNDLREFDSARRINRVPDEDDLAPGQYQLLEFDRLAQSPNDGGALKFRLDVLDDWLASRLGE